MTLCGKGMLVDAVERALRFPATSLHGVEVRYTLSVCRSLVGYVLWEQVSFPKVSIYSANIDDRNGANEKEAQELLSIHVPIF
jgi:hypothetical protein